MRSLGRLIALLAAIMLVIGGMPSAASAKACDPCPPDCPMMMQQRAATPAADHGSAPAKGGKADNICQQMIACQNVAATVAPSVSVKFVTLSAASVTHEAFDPLQAPSRPPDRSLRPPIQP